MMCEKQVQACDVLIDHWRDKRREHTFDLLIDVCDHYLETLEEMKEGLLSSAERKARW